MQAEQILTFGPYRFAPQTGQLWRGKHEVSLTRKATAVLHYLLERAGQVVTKEELFQAVWADTVVSDAALTSCIQELRHALHDNARKPRYIETVHRRGFRFLGKVASDQFSVVSNEDNKQGARSREHGGKISLSSPAPNTQHLTPVMVGRETDLAFLDERLVKALHGERQLIFVTGEPGIGKTTVVDVYLALAEKRQDSAFIVAGCRLLVNATYWSGQFVAAHECCERAINTGYNPLHHRAFALACGFDPLMTCLGVGAWALWYLGYPDQALQRSQAALTLAQKLAHPYALAWMLNAASWVHFYRREGWTAASLADEAITLSQQHEFPHWLAMGKWMRGQALIEYGHKEGISQLQEGLQAYQATGAIIGTRGCGRAEVARGCGQREQVAEGLRIINEALSGLNQVRHESGASL